MSTYTNQQIIHQYSIFISEQTINTQKSSLYIANLLSSQFNLQSVTKIELNVWWKSYTSTKSQATKLQRLATIHKLFKFMEEFDIRSDNPSKVLTVTRDKKDKSATYNLLSRSDYDKMFSDSKIDDSLRTAIALTVFAGLRNSEVCNLLVSDIDLENETIYIRDAKSGSAQIPIPSLLTNMIKDYMKSNKVADGYLIRNKKMKKMDEQNFRQRYKTVLRKHGLSEKFKIHDNRHFCASTLANSPSVSIVSVKEILRHGDLKTSQRYIHSDTKEIKQQINSVW